MIRQAAALALVMNAATASALVPSARVALAPGEDRFLKPGFAAVSVVVDPPGRVTAEPMPAGEIYVTVPADAKGPFRLLAIGRDRAAPFDLCVGESSACPATTHVAAAKAACPDLEERPDDGPNRWFVTVRDERCLEALRTSLEHAEMSPDRLRLMLEEQSATSLVRSVLAEIAADRTCAGLTAGFYGPTLMLSGKASRAAVDRAVWIAHRMMPASLSFDLDQLTLTDPAPARIQAPPVELIPVSQSRAASIPGGPKRSEGEK